MVARGPFVGHSCQVAHAIHRGEEHAFANPAPLLWIVIAEPDG
jgi:hypothetical protein